MGSPSGRPRILRLVSRLAASMLVLALVLFIGLELTLSGPLGMSGFVVYRTVRTWVRDATLPAVPSLADYSNAGPNVIVIVLDCFRHSYLEDSAPTLRRFADASWQFDRYYSQASWTKPSTASLFTGLVVRKHFVMKGGGSQLPQEAVTLAELMQEQGFSTGGFMWNPHLTWRQAFDQGFDVYVDDARRGSKSLLFEFFDWLDRERPERFFAYIHFEGTHDPYYMDNDLSVLLSAPSYEGDLDFSTLEYKDTVRNGLPLSPEAAAHLEYIAEGKARRLDREAVAGFLQHFDASGLPENTMLVFTSDHGDAFYEHEHVSHGHTMFNEEIHVPLAIRFPESFAQERGFPLVGRDSACPASTVDLLPTVLDFVGAPVPAGVDGASLVPRPGGADACQKAAVSEQAVQQGRITGAALVRGQRKLIVDYEKGTTELFDLTADPAEARDLSAAQPAEAAALAAELRERLNADGASMAEWDEVEGEIPEEQRDLLRALGYGD